jgi:cell division protein ZapA
MLDLLSMCVLQFATRMLFAERQSQYHEVGLEISVQELDLLLTDLFKK